MVRSQYHSKCMLWVLAVPTPCTAQETTLALTRVRVSTVGGALQPTGWHFQISPHTCTHVPHLSTCRTSEPRPRPSSYLRSQVVQLLPSLCPLLLKLTSQLGIVRRCTAAAGKGSHLHTRKCHRKCTCTGQLAGMYECACSKHAGRQRSTTSSCGLHTLSSSSTLETSHATFCEMAYLISYMINDAQRK